MDFKIAILALLSAQKCICGLHLCINQEWLQTCSLGRAPATAQNGARTQVKVVVWQHNVLITQGHTRQNRRIVSLSCAFAPYQSTAQSRASSLGWIFRFRKVTNASCTGQREILAALCGYFSLQLSQVQLWEYWHSEVREVLLQLSSAEYWRQDRLSTVFSLIEYLLLHHIEDQLV